MNKKYFLKVSPPAATRIKLSTYLFDFEVEVAQSETGVVALLGNVALATSPFVYCQARPFAFTLPFDGGFLF